MQPETPNDPQRAQVQHLVVEQALLRRELAALRHSLWIRGLCLWLALVPLVIAVYVLWRAQQWGGTSRLETLEVEEIILAPASEKYKGETYRLSIGPRGIRLEGYKTAEEALAPKPDSVRSTVLELDVHGITVHGRRLAPAW